MTKCLLIILKMNTYLIRMKKKMMMKIFMNKKWTMMRMYKRKVKRMGDLSIKVPLLKNLEKMRVL